MGADDGETGIDDEADHSFVGSSPAPDSSDVTICLRTFRAAHCTGSSVSLCVWERGINRSACVNNTRITKSDYATGK